MTGNFVDNIRFKWKSPVQFEEGFFYLETDFGNIRVFDTKGAKPVVVNVPDGPNVIEHQLPLIQNLSKDYRVVCFEYPGIGFSYPNSRFDYSFKNGADLLVQIMDLLALQKVALLFSCSNGFYAIQAASDYPDRFKHLFLSQTPSTEAMLKWTDKSIPTMLKIPIVGQLSNAIFARKFADTWYKYALPRNHPHRLEYAATAKASLAKGGCFCLASLVYGLKEDRNTPLSLLETPATLVWGERDFTHRKTDKESIKAHIKNCEIIEFADAGHFPELEKTQKYVRLMKERVS
jgi:pimeloyl-ACP methyl ester carboxylesterase